MPKRHRTHRKDRSLLTAVEMAYVLQKNGQMDQQMWEHLDATRARQWEHEDIALVMLASMQQVIEQNHKPADIRLQFDALVLALENVFNAPVAKTLDEEELVYDPSSDTWGLEPKPSTAAPTERN